MTPDSEVIKKAVEQARSHVKDHKDTILPTFFVGTEEGIHIFGAPFENNQQKDIVAQAIRLAAKELKATYVLFIAESWMVRAVDNQVKELTVPVSEHPDRIDAVMFTLETHEGTWVGMAEIKPGREMQEPTWNRSEGSMGRFTNFLDKSETKH